MRKLKKLWFKTVVPIHKNKLKEDKTITSIDYSNYSKIFLTVHVKCLLTITIIIGYNSYKQFAYLNLISVNSQEFTQDELMN